VRKPNSPEATFAGRFGIAIVILAGLAGCAQTKDWLYGNRTDESAPASAGGEDSLSFVQEMYKLVTGDPATQAEIYADSSAAATLTPDPASRTRFALVLATPGHAGSDPERAQDMLRELLSQPALLTPTERSLATIQLHELEARLVLETEARRLRSESSRAERLEAAAAAQRLAAVEAENQQLKQSLAEAEQKLEAITTIERSIREQTDDNSQ
jgi:hypothetical protein